MCYSGRAPNRKQQVPVVASLADRDFGPSALDSNQNWPASSHKTMSVPSPIVLQCTVDICTRPHETASSTTRNPRFSPQKRLGRPGQWSYTTIQTTSLPCESSCRRLSVGRAGRQRRCRPRAQNQQLNDRRRVSNSERNWLRSPATVTLDKRQAQASSARHPGRMGNAVRG